VFRKLMAALSVSGIALAAIAASAVPSSASLLKSSGSHTSHSGGTSPHSELCRLVRENVSEGTQVSDAVEKAASENNWQSAQKTLQSVFNQEDKLERQMYSAISGAPHDVKAAASGTLKSVPTIQKAVNNSKNFSQFETAIEKIVNSKKFEAYAQTFTQYETRLCGTITTTTT